jgi:hypothetical protein
MTTNVALNRRKILTIALLSIGNLPWQKRGELLAQLMNRIVRLGEGMS